MSTPKPTYSIVSRPVSKVILTLQVLFALLYLYTITFKLDRGNDVLYGALVLSEIFHVWLVLTLVYTIWPRKLKRIFDVNYQPSLDIFITVVNEPLDIVTQTVIACQNINYSNKKDRKSVV